MSEHDLEMMKLQMQRDAEARADLRERDMRRQDLFKWVIMGIVGLVNPFLHIATTYYEQRLTGQVKEQISDVAEKATIAAAKAEETDRTSLKTNIALNDWKASYTRDPMDELHANEARVRLQAASQPQIMPPSPNKQDSKQP